MSNAQDCFDMLIAVINPLTLHLIAADYMYYLFFEPRVPDGVAEKNVLPPLEDAFFAVIGFCTLGFPAEPWLAGFLL